MCRHAHSGPYKDHFACFSCRKSFKKPSARDGAVRFDAVGQPIVIRCPQCRGAMVDLGLDFKPPKQSDVRQWRKVQLLHEYGFTFHSCGCGGPGLRPKEQRDVALFLRGQLPEDDGERLLRLIGERARSTNQH